MSVFSGKCDFCDFLTMSESSEEEIIEKIKKYKVYRALPLPEGFNYQAAIESNVNIAEEYYEKLHFNSFGDLVPFFPHLICYSSGNTICISNRSFVDVEEEELLQYKFKNVLRIYNRCKRKKVEFTVDAVIDEVAADDFDREQYRIIAERISRKGKKATTDGIHLKLHEYYREKLVEEMVKYNLNPADYGYERFCDFRE